MRELSQAYEARAMRELNRSANFSSKKARAYVEAAKIWLHQGNRGDAIQALERAVDKGNPNPDTLRLLVDAYRKEGRIVDADRASAEMARLDAIVAKRKEILDKIQSGEDLVPNLVRLGNASAELRDGLESLAAFEAALRLDPKNKGAAAGIDLLMGRRSKT